jgi:nitric oxide reductase activation protein
LTLEALDYLPHLFGTYGFTIVDRIDRLPAHVAEIYRRLTR